MRVGIISRGFLVSIFLVLGSSCSSSNQLSVQGQKELDTAHCNSLVTGLSERSQERINAQGFSCSASMTTLRGTVQVAISDDFENQAFEEIYMMETSVGGKRELIELYNIESVGGHGKSDTVEIQGYRSGTSFLAMPSSPLSLSNNQNDVPTTGEITYKVFLVQASDSTLELDVPFIKGVFTDAEKIVEEGSFGKLRVNYEFHPTIIQLDVTSDSNEYHSGYVVSQFYDRPEVDGPFVIAGHFPNEYLAGWAFVGGEFFFVNLHYTTLPAQDDIANRPYAVQTVAHENGHNLGLRHSNLLRCNGISEDCDLIFEYRDIFAVMGGGFIRTNVDFSGPHKEKLGWFDSDTLMEATSTGEYTIYSPSNPTGRNTTLRIPRGYDDYLYIDVQRDPLDQPGAVLRITEKAGKGTERNESTLLRYSDRTIYSNTTRQDDSILLLDQTWVDPATNTSVEVMQASYDELKVHVTLGTSTFQNIPVSLDTNGQLPGQRLIPIKITGEKISSLSKVDYYIETQPVSWSTDSFTKIGTGYPPFFGITLNQHEFLPERKRLKALAYDKSGELIDAWGGVNIARDRITLVNGDQKKPEVNVHSVSFIKSDTTYQMAG